MKSLRTEDEIIANWKSDSGLPVVSICCITYNHESYIEDALKGFLIQETDFPFEILIHDDASIDKTADIIRAFQEKYPRIIKPIYQVENQYSKGLKINPTYNFPRAKGKYIALCEGDDFWLSEDKLARQYSCMEEEPDILVSFHAASINDESGKFSNQTLGMPRSNNCIIDVSDVISGGGGFMPTASLMFRRSQILNKNLNRLLNSYPVGDYCLQICLSYPRGALYLDGIMSVYRYESLGSWSRRMRLFESDYDYTSSSISFLRDVAETWPELRTVCSSVVFKRKVSFIKRHPSSVFLLRFYRMILL